MTFTIPEAPTANTYYRNVKGKTLLSAAARRYKQDVNAAIMTTLANEKRTIASVKVAGPAIVYVNWHRAIRSGDLDNRLKPTLDSLKGLLFIDDAQVVAIYAQRFDSPRNGRMVVSVVPFDAARAPLSRDSTEPPQ